MGKLERRQESHDLCGLGLVCDWGWQRLADGGGVLGVVDEDGVARGRAVRGRDASAIGCDGDGGGGIRVKDGVVGRHRGVERDCGVLSPLSEGTNVGRW